MYVDKHFNTFTNLIKEQLSYGAVKYASKQTDRESTDELFDRYGKNWLLGTIDKYTFRFTNLKRERDLLKIAAYMYILWLKRGFHIDEKRIVAIDTNIANKNTYFNAFIKKFQEYRNWQNSDFYTIKYPLKVISGSLKRWSELEWKEIREYDLFYVLDASYFAWEKDYKDIKEHDKDTEKEHEAKNTKH